MCYFTNVQIQYRNPSAQLVNIPYRITGPAMVKILHPMPKTCPSFLYSIAGAATELANPVMGTSAPAPPHFASRGINTGSGEENTEKNKEEGGPAAALLC